MSHDDLHTSLSKPAVKPVASPGVATVAVRSNIDRPVKILGGTLHLPDPIKHDINRAVDNAHRWGERTRNGALEKAPAAAVNNSSNIIAGMHLLAEGFMFKASGKLLYDDTFVGKRPWHQYIWEPPKRIMQSVWLDSKAAGSTRRSMLKPSSYVDGVKELFDVKGSTFRDTAAMARGDRLHNRWQSRATLTGVIGWSLSFATPDYKEKRADVERYAEMSVKHPALYLATRVKQAIFFPFETAIKVVKKPFDPTKDQEIGKNKAAFTGLGVIIYGIWSTIGAWRNTGTKVQGDELRKGYEWLKNLHVGQKYYYFNPMYLATGLVSIFAGIPLIFGTNSERNWVGFGTHMQLRSVFLPFSIAKQFRNSGDGAWYYTAAHTIFQAHNAVSSLIGGAKKVKQEDGTYKVVDYAEESKVLQERARIEKNAEREEKQQEAEGTAGDIRVNHAASQKNESNAEAPLLPSNLIASHIAHEQRLAEAPVVLKDGA